jgi:hypothetical protein
MKGDLLQKALAGYFIGNAVGAFFQQDVAGQQDLPCPLTIGSRCMV